MLFIIKQSMYKNNEHLKIFEHKFVTTRVAHLRCKGSTCFKGISEIKQNTNRETIQIE